MKLIFCPECQDVVKLLDRPRRCDCGQSWGSYMEDGLHAEIAGKAIPIGFNNSTLAQALKVRPASGMGARFEAFVIPKDCPTILEKV
jgi:hypothetical protein